MRRPSPESTATPPPAPAPPAGGGGVSFTALLGLPTPAAMEMLMPARSSNSSPSSRGSSLERAARTPAKRKEASGFSDQAKEKRRRAAAEEEDTRGNQMNYVHVRARRGEATDSHSLAERARREKINRRMELLKALVPGCSKVSGTALVLDEIINHVLFLQRQVEYLSMRLAAASRRVDFGGIDGFLAAECGRITGLHGKIGPDYEQATWQEDGVHGARHLLQQQLYYQDPVQPYHLSSMSPRHTNDQSHVLPNSRSSLFGYNLAASATTQPNNIKSS